MSRRKVTVPKYLHHKPSGQAYARVPTATGGRKLVYLGKFDSPESKANYERLLAELRASPAAATMSRRAAGLSVNEVLLAFAKHADAHYRDDEGKPTREVTIFRQIIRLIREMYGPSPAAEFGPLALKAVRLKMVDAGLCRTLINRRVGRIKMMFKWMASEELVPPSVYQGLATVSGLQKGKTTAPERPPVLPVPDAVVAATLPHLAGHVAGMVELQRLTGMRPGEVCRIRPAEVDSAGDFWVYRPGRHKSDWRGKTRTITIGPKGQAVLARFVPPEPAGFYFSPRRCVEEVRAARSAARKTPRWPSHMARNVAKRKPKPARVPAERYNTMGYAKAVVQGIAKANAAAAKHDVPAGHHGPNLPRVPHWHPNQLRHTHGTEVRRRFGLEAAQVVLGHARADVTQVYAERDASLAEKIASEIG